jgi:NADH-quinone oxidoreductase subunit H
MNEFLIRLAIIAGMALFYALFAMNVAVVLTWVDRRQGSMIQDRVGPERAVIFLPGKLAAAAVLLPAVAVAAGVLAWASVSAFDENSRGLVALLFSQLAILFTWITAVAIAGRVRIRGAKSAFDVFVRGFGDPRHLVWAGLGLHIVTLVAAALTRGIPEGLLLEEVGLKSGPAVLAFVIVLGAVYAASIMAREKQVGLRLLGLLHPAADGIKSIFKEDIIPASVDRLVHSIAPLIAFFPVLIVMAVIPFGDSLCLGPTGDATSLLVPLTETCRGQVFGLQLVDLDVGLLFFFALGGTGIIGATLAGWSSNNKYSLLGSLRAASQMVSYEVTLGLTLIGAIMIYGTLRIDQMILWQAEHTWGIFVQPVAFVLFFTAAVAESKRIPFDLPEGESELVAGYFTEYSGMKFAMFFFAEYVAVVTGSALMAAMFFGGWSIPFMDRDGLRVIFGQTVWLHVALPQIVVVLVGVGAFIGKTLMLCWLQLMIRWTLPRFRYDQLMNLGWRKLLPLSLVNILVTATGLMVLSSVSGETTERTLLLLGQITEGVVAIIGLIFAVAFILFVMKPVSHRKLVVTSSARFAEMLGGTPIRGMGA